MKTDKFKVLIADDEYIIRRGLASFVAMDEECEVVAACEDGKSALEAIAKTNPDIMFIDINMPFVNGLDLIQEANKINDEIITFIISGYDKFEYVQSAIRFGVKGYILKPVSEEKFFETLDLGKSMVKKNREYDDFLAAVKKRIEENFELLVNRFILDLLEDNLSETDVKETLLSLSLTYSKTNSITLLTYTPREYSSTFLEVWKDEHIYFGIKNVLEQHGIVLITLLENLNIVALCNEKLEEAQLQTIRQEIEEKIPIHLHIATSFAEGFAFDERYRELSLETSVKYSSLIEDVLHYINENFTKEEFSLQLVATDLFVSKQYLSRIFSYEVGMNFNQYVNQKKMTLATKLLKDKHNKIVDISRLLGYSTQSYFSNCFKKHFGLSPQEYRDADM